MKFDSEVANSNGFFKDPATRQPLTGNEERVVKCELLESGKLIWPQVKFSDGSQGKIVFALWTQEEKAIYKQYRSRGKQRPAVESCKAKEEHEDAPAVQERDEAVIAVKYNEAEHNACAVAGSTLAYIKQCDRHIGVWLFDGVVYDLITKEGAKGYQPVPRKLIPKQELVRLGIM